MDKKYGVIYYKNTDNIGDDIQTYAALKHLNKCDYFIDRESLDSFIPSKKEQVITIMNGWYLHKRYNWPISPYVYPLLISMHFSANDLYLTRGHKYLDGYAKECLMKYGPIGCRDLGTKKELDKLGYDTYYSGCMTMTIPPVKKRQKKAYICTVDLKDEINAYVEKQTSLKIKKMTHWVDPNIHSLLTPQERMKKVEDLLKTYQDATLVITDRLHTALPCLAMGVPVLLIYYEHNADRLETFKKYLNSISEKEFFKMNKKDFEKIKNKNNHLEVVKELNKKIEDLLKVAEANINNNDLPSLDNYKDTVNRMEYLKETFLNKIYEDMDLIEQKTKENKMIINSKDAVINNLLSDPKINFYNKIKISRKILKSKNKTMTIKNIRINNTKIEYFYKFSKDIKDYFNLDENFSIEMNENLKNVPEGIAVIPFVCNVLPLIWLEDITLEINELDENFFYSIKKIRKEYQNMLPNLKFAGTIKVKKIINYKSKLVNNDSCIFFTGGIDSFSTLLRVKDKKPKLVTVWGSDIDFENVDGWHYVKEYTKEIAQQFNLENVYLKASLRRFLRNDILENKFHQLLNDNWWHALQHSIGMLGLIAPYAYLHNLKTIYFPGTYSINDKNFICASRPEIDENLKFMNVKIIHEGFEYTRFQKTKQICDYEDKQSKLHVCYRSLNGENCCVCEKCARTIMTILSLKKDPRNYGFNIISNTYDRIRYHLENNKYDLSSSKIFWKDIQKSFKENGFNEDSYFGWFLTMKF